jgi:signal transduction histidine kinase/ActR/RegA family two-component response regulator
MRLRTRLFQLVAGTVVPLVVLAITLGALLATAEQETFRNGALARIRALMTAVDAELRGHFRVVQALGASRSLAEDDLRSFYQDAARALLSQPDWQNIMLALPNGRQLVNLASPFGASLIGTPDKESAQEVVDTLHPVVGNVFFGSSTQKHGVPVRVPILNDELQLAYVLTAVIDPDAFGKIIRAQELPATWVSGLIDATGHFIARVPPLSHEHVASEDFLAAVRSVHEGWYRGLTIERVDTYTAFKVSGISEWSVGIAIPASEVNAGARHAAWIIVLGTLVSVAIALSFAFWLGRRIAQPISQLATSARALGEGNAPTNAAMEADIQEVRAVARALNETSKIIGERHALLEREQAALREADRAKDEFLAMLGHELRNPLGAITTSAQVLSVAEPGGEMARQSHAIIERQTRHMTRLIDDLLDVSRLTMGKVTLKREPFDLARLVTNVARTWERTGRVPAGRIKLGTQEVWVNADRARIEQVLSNLLDNASKFSPADRPIRVSTCKHGEHAVLEVTDEGDGIAPDLLQQVFGLFVQGDSVPSRVRSGMGVGLALVKRLVEMHGGTVDAASAGLGHGASFSVRLPAAAAMPADTSGESPSAPGSSLQALRILVTEDNADAREMMEAMLALDGHEVRGVRDGAQTLVAMEQSLPDVVLMDIGLPDMDGYELARHISEIDAYRQVKLIALTGFGQPEDEQRAYDAGFDLHLTKPVAPQTLRDVLMAFTRGGGAAK